MSYKYMSLAELLTSYGKKSDIRDKQSRTCATTITNYEQMIDIYI